MFLPLIQMYFSRYCNFLSCHFMHSWFFLVFAHCVVLEVGWGGHSERAAGTFWGSSVWCRFPGGFAILGKSPASVPPQVDKHIRRLDADLARFEADLKDKMDGSDFESSGGRGLKSKSADVSFVLLLLTMGF